MPMQSLVPAIQDIVLPGALMAEDPEHGASPAGSRDQMEGGCPEDVGNRDEDDRSNEAWEGVDRIAASQQQCDLQGDTGGHSEFTGKHQQGDDQHPILLDQ